MRGGQNLPSPRASANMLTGDNYCPPSDPNLPGFTRPVKMKYLWSHNKSGHSTVIWSHNNAGHGISVAKTDVYKFIRQVGESGHSPDTFSLDAICSVTIQVRRTTNTFAVGPMRVLHHYRKTSELT